MLVSSVQQNDSVIHIFIDMYLYILYVYICLLFQFLSTYRLIQNMSIVPWVLLLLLLFSCSVVSDSLWPHGLQHTRLPNMLLEISGEIIPERMKRWNQSKNNTQLWMRPLMEVKSDAVKSNIAKEPAMLGPWIKANWKWSNRRWQEWTSTF